MKIANFAPLSPRFFGACVTLAANVLFGRVLNRPVPRGPLFVTWLLTFDCNAFCGFCGTHTLKNRYPEAISVERALEIADEIADAGTWVVGFTGGEVFMSPLLFPLIERLKQRGLVVYVVTNGLNLKEYAARLVDLKVDFVQVSIDYADAERHDDNRKVEGLFESAFVGVEEIKKLRKSNIPALKTNTVIMHDNLDEMDEILDFLESRVDTAHAQPISYEFENSPHHRDKDRIHRYIFDPKDRDEIERKLKDKVFSRQGFGGSYFRLIPTYWFEPASLIDKVPCWAPFLRLMIQPNGDTLHCAANSRFGAVGNLALESLMSIWNGPEIRGHRAIIGAKKNGCICWTRDTAFNPMMKDIPLINRLPYLGKSEPEPPAPISDPTTEL